MRREEKIVCGLCGRAFKPRAGQSAYDWHAKPPPHKCRHGKRCKRYAPECDACLAVLEVKEEVLRPPCVFCSPASGLYERPKLDCYASTVLRDAAAGGCPACGYSSITRGRSRHGDPELLAELRETTGDVWATR